MTTKHQPDSLKDLEIIIMPQICADFRAPTLARSNDQEVAFKLTPPDMGLKFTYSDINTNDNAQNPLVGENGVFDFSIYYEPPFFDINNYTEVSHLDLTEDDFKDHPDEEYDDFREESEEERYEAHLEHLSAMKEDLTENEDRKDGEDFWWYGEDIKFYAPFDY